MSSVRNNEDINELTYEIRENLDSLSGLINKLQCSQTDKKVEKEQCIEAMKDYIQLIEDKTNRIALVNSDDKIIIGLSANAEIEFKMKNTKALVVDDNSINNYVITQMLSHFEIETDVAESGERALELFEENEYDLILMDYLMPPGIDGVETVRRIREMNERGKKQLIIGLTAYTIDEFRKGLNSYGVEIIIFKPVKFQQMAVILKKELKDKICY